jgi:chitinase
MDLKTGGIWQSEWDDFQKVPYLTSQKTWVSYDNEESIKQKVEFAKGQNMAGVLIWSLDTDDFRGSCSGEKFPLLKTIQKTFAKPEINTGNLHIIITTTCEAA